MARPPLHPPPPPESAAVEEEIPDEALDAEDLAAVALEDRAPLTSARLKALNETYRAVCHADDEGSRTLKRRIEGRLRRASHLELHPGCERVTTTIPALPNKQFIRINERVYFGPMELWDCESRTIWSMVHIARLVEAQRMDDRQSEHPTMDLDSPLAERARIIQRA